MQRFLVVIAWLIIAGTVTFLGYNQLRLEREVKTALQNITPSQQAEIPSPTNNDDVAPALISLQASVAALQAQVTQLKNSPGKTQTVTQTVTSPSAPGQTFQTQIIYLGAASTTSNNWTNTGVQITLNSADYPAGVPVMFQAGLSIIGGQAWARLINTTTGAIMDITQVQNGTSVVTWVNSPTFLLASGSNTYTVQMRSTSGEIAQLSGARLVIGN